MAKTPKILNAHAKKRAEERYGVELNKHARREIVQQIKSQQAEFVSKQSNNRSGMQRAGFPTCYSCEGGKGHQFDRPISGVSSTKMSP